MGRISKVDQAEAAASEKIQQTLSDISKKVRIFLFLFLNFFADQED